MHRIKREKKTHTAPTNDSDVLLIDCKWNWFENRKMNSWNIVSTVICTGHEIFSKYVMKSNERMQWTFFLFFFLCYEFKIRLNRAKYIICSFTNMFSKKDQSLNFSIFHLHSEHFHCRDCYSIYIFFFCSINWRPKDI